MLKINPLACDSLGTRSMATLVSSGKVKIVIDPGVSLGPRRYGLPPHELEYKAYYKQWADVVSAASSADALVITHYHYDHHNPFEDLEIFKGKTVFVKDPEKNINQSQKKRAREFLSKLQDTAGKIEIADGNEFKLKDMLINFSPAVPHGPEGTKLGYVVMTSLRTGSECFVHSSDSQGPSVRKTTDWIISQRPETVLLDGIATIFLGWAEDPAVLGRANNEEIRLLESGIKTMIIDHHLVRDINYRNKIKPVIDKAQELKKKLLTSAEYKGLNNNFLEANRKKLWENGGKQVKNIPVIMKMKDL